MESFVQQGFNLTVFGAGHVAKALMTILGGLPGQVRWIDNREDMFPNADQVPANVTMQLMDNPIDIIEQLPENSQVLVLTHNHQLDFDLVEAALKRNCFSYVGCIGSNTKAERFRMRLQHRGFSETHIEQMICPVGNLDVPGKLPMEVAVSMAGQLITHLHNMQADTSGSADSANAKANRQGVSWKEMKKIMHEA